MIIYNGQVSHCTYWRGNRVFNFSKPQPNNEIWYTSSDGSVVRPDTSYFVTGLRVVSNTYSDGKGIIVCSGDIPNIAAYSFENRSKLTSISIPSSVTWLGAYAFQGCTGLTSINIPSSVTNLGFSTFNGCSRLTSITIPDGEDCVSESVFKNCTSLTSIKIPSSVTWIRDYAFNGCTGLTSITCEATTPPSIDLFVFDNTNNCPIYVPYQSVSVYKTTWTSYASRIQAIQ